MSAAATSYAARAIDRLAEEGLKLTAQRRAIVELFDSGHHHWTPQAVFASLQSSVPSLSLATVYNTMDVFERIGLVRRVTTRDGCTYFDTHLGHHHHAVCDECGAVIDVLLEESDVASLVSRIDLPVEIERTNIWFQGTCRDCVSV